MPNPKHLLALGLSLAAAAFSGCRNSPPPPPTLQAPSTQYVRQMVEYLAADRMDGRGLGTKGLDEAAGYIAGRFHQLDLKTPPGQDSYFQPFTFTQITGVDPQTRLSLGDQSLKLNDDFVPFFSPTEGQFDGPIVFAGYGVSFAGTPTTQPYDDFAGLDLKGKVVMVLRFEPHDDKGNSRLTGSQDNSPSAAFRAKARAAKEKGAVAMLVVHPPAHRGKESLLPFNRDNPLPLPTFHITQRAADDLLKRNGAKPLAELQKQIDSGFKPIPVPLNVSAKGDLAYKRDTHDLKNVTAILPGKGKLAERYIVIGAHYDHVGVGLPGASRMAVAGPPTTQPQTYNGADDNASGTAAMLELARLFAQSTPLPRSLVFVGFSAEESGLIGSQHWVNNPPVALKQIDAMINLDMVGRLAPDNGVLVNGRPTAAAFDAILKAVDAQSPLEFKPTIWDNARMAPSDITSFHQKQIPGLFFSTGLHPDYHRPSDDADKINYPGLSEMIDAVGRVVVALAYQQGGLAFVPPPAPPTRPATGPTTTASTEMLRAGGASIGVMPDYAAVDSKEGMRISGASPNSAAAAAGLKPGDTITHLAGKPVTNVYDYMPVLESLTPGKPVKIRILRDGKPMELDVTPTARRTSH